MGSLDWLSLRGDGRHGHGHGPLGTVDPAVRTKTDDDLCLSGTGVRSSHRRSSARRIPASNPSSGGAVYIRWDGSSLLSLEGGHGAIDLDLRHGHSTATK